MSKAKLQAARELIQEKEYAAARAVLETISYDETAQKWLQRLPGASEAPQAPRRRGWILTVLIFIVGLVLGVMIGGTPSRPKTAAAPTARATSAAAATAGPSPTITETLTPTLSPSPTETPTATATKTPTLTPVPLIFSDSAASVVGPVSIEAGIYKAIFTTTGYGIVSITATEGECGQGRYFSSSIFLLSEGQASSGAETVFNSAGCTALIEVSNVQAAWTLKFEKVG